MTPETHSGRYFALLYSPDPQRRVLEALFGIEREISQSLRPGIDHRVAHSRLQWWREECERAAVGRPVHPLTRTLVDVLAGAGPSVPALAGLGGLVDVAVWDLAGATFETRRELTAYCERWAAAMIEPLAPRRAPDAPPLGSTQAADVTPEAMPANATKWGALGAAIREIEMLSHLARDAHYGRLRVPLDELESANAEPDILAKPPWPAAVVEMLRVRHATLREEITRAVGEVDRDQQAGLRGLLVWAALARRSSERTARALPDGLHTGQFGTVTDAWFAWRIARRATLGRFRLN